ncbi:MAG: translation initiation factor IF-3 [Phycisphaerae bacterium]|jgi:translation initiation factor IF-3|nr:translation initiation factor IF-3 [Phycisphaerae bacterium]MBT5365107.1 translation initiation factor IF-3 [Phycisphaerae bacterium]MBT6269075.1 translation initiation factor IF-3 [Phycisphaerae bacterium]MBT6282709.1 translation initiation factor IF-3 [Phycisphaerae bacterium]
MEKCTIARRRYIKPRENARNLPKINDRIRANQVRLIDQDENMLGVVDKTEGIRLAQEAGLDLVEVSPHSDPPVCRILDFGKYRYEQSKKERANRAKTKTVETKEVRLGRSMKIDPHDVQIRVNQARKFLLEGHKVLIVQNFRGREMMHKERGSVRMKEIIDKLSDVSKVETPPKFAGRRQTMVLGPDKLKIKSYLDSQLAAEKAQQVEIDSQQEDFDS